MKKRLLAMFSCLIMVMALLPATAFAGTPKDTSVFIAGVELTSGSSYYHNGENGAPGTVNANETDYNAYFNADEGTLTLKGLNVSNSTATIETPHGTATYAIYAVGDLTIYVDGDNSVSVKAVSETNKNVNSLALYVTKEMTVQPVGTGRGSLTAESKGAQITSDAGEMAMCNGVTSNKLFVESGATLIGEVSGESNASNVFNAGVNTDAVTVYGGTLKGIASGDVMCGTGDTCITCGIMVYNGDLSLFAGSVEATGGQALSSKGKSFGVAMTGQADSIIINGGSFTATSGHVPSKATTCAVQNTLSLGSSITAKGSTSIDGSNPVTYNADKNATYKWVSAGMPTVKSVMVNPATVSMQKGGNQTFNATVLGVYNPAQTVTWTVDGGIVGTSISPNGVLTVAANETAKTLIVKATSKVNTKKFGTATVTVTTPTDPDPIEHKIIKGQNGKWTEGSTSGLSFTADGDYDTFTGVSVDGITLSSDEYTSQSGSTIVTLKAAYLETLSVGQHALRINFTDGSAETHFTINATTDPDNPATGDISQPLLWLGIALLACTGLVASLVLARRKRQNG